MHSPDRHSTELTSPKQTGEVCFVFLIIVIIALAVPAYATLYKHVPSDSVLLPTKCESCVMFAREMDAAMKELNKAMARDDAEIWLIEKLETVCKHFLHYKIHKEKTGIARFSPDSSDTIKSLKKLRERGVEVELGMPEDLWEAPSEETNLLMQHCEWIIEEYENEISYWFWNKFKKSRRSALHDDKQNESLQSVLCQARFAEEVDESCLAGEPVYDCENSNVYGCES